LGNLTIILPDREVVVPVVDGHPHDSLLSPPCGDIPCVQPELLGEHGAAALNLKWLSSSGSVVENPGKGVHSGIGFVGLKEEEHYFFGRTEGLTY
jgi:hypothetical protein